MVQRPLYAHDPESSLFAIAIGSSPVQIWRAKPGASAESGPREEAAAGELRLDGVGQVVGLALEGQVLVTVLSGGEVAGWDLGGLIEEGSEATVRSLWRIETGLRLVCAAHHRGNSKRPRLAMGAESGEVLLLELHGESAPKLARGAVHRDKIEVLSFSQDDACLASSARDRLIVIWSTELGDDETLKPQRELRGSGGWPLALAFSEDHRRLVSGCMDNGVYLWDLEAEEPLEAVRFDHAGWVDDVCWAGGDAVIVSASWDNCVGVFGATPLKPRFLMGFHTDYVVRLMAVPRTTLVVAASYDGRLTVWDWALGQLEGVLSGHADWVTEMVWLGRGRLASLSSDGTARLWSLKTMRCEVVLGRAPVERFELGGSFDLASFGVGAETTRVGAPGDEEELATATVRRFDGRGERWQSGVHRTALAMMDEAMASARSIFGEDSEGAQARSEGSKISEVSAVSETSEVSNASPTSPGAARSEGKGEAAGEASLDDPGSGYVFEDKGESVGGGEAPSSDAPDPLDDLDAELDALEDALDALSEVGEVGDSDSWFNSWSNEHPDSGMFERPATSPASNSPRASEAEVAPHAADALSEPEVFPPTEDGGEIEASPEASLEGESDAPAMGPGAAISESGPISEPEGGGELTEVGLVGASADSESAPSAEASPPAEMPVEPDENVEVAALDEATGDLEESVERLAAADAASLAILEEHSEPALATPRADDAEAEANEAEGAEDEPSEGIELEGAADDLVDEGVFSSIFEPSPEAPVVLDASRAGLSNLVRDAISEVVEVEPSEPDVAEKVEHVEKVEAAPASSATEDGEPESEPEPEPEPEPEIKSTVKRSLRARLKAATLKLRQEEAEQAEQNEVGAAADAESDPLDIMGEAFDLPSEVVRSAAPSTRGEAQADEAPKPVGVDPDYNPVPIEPGDAIADLVPDDLAFDEVFGAFGDVESQEAPPAAETASPEVEPAPAESDAAEVGMASGDEGDEASAGEEANAASAPALNEDVSEPEVAGASSPEEAESGGDAGDSESAEGIEPSVEDENEDLPETSGADSTHELRVAEVEALAAASEVGDEAPVTSPGLKSLRADDVTGRIEVHPEVAASVSGEEAVGAGTEPLDEAAPGSEVVDDEDAAPVVERSGELAVSERPGEVSGARTLTSFLGSAVRDEREERDEDDAPRWPTAASEAKRDAAESIKVEQNQQDASFDGDAATQMLDADALPPVAGSSPWAEERSSHRTARRGVPAREVSEPAALDPGTVPVFEEDEPVAPTLDPVAEESEAEVDENYGNSTQMWGGLFNAPGGVRDPGPERELTRAQDLSAFARREKTQGRGQHKSEAEATRRSNVSDHVRGILRGEEALPEMTLGDASTSAQSVPEALIGAADSEVSSRLQPGQAARKDELVVPEVAAASQQEGAQRLSLGLEEFWDRATAAAPGMAILKRKVGALGDYAPARQLRVEERGPLMLASVESGRRMALCGASRELTLWQARGELETKFEVRGPLVALSFLVDEASLCGVAESGELWMWMLPRAALGKASRVAEATIATGDSALRCAAVDVAARRVLTGNEEGRVRVWNLERGQCVGRLAPHASPVTAVAFGARGVISASADGQVRFWNPQGFLIDQLEGQGRVMALATFEGEVAWVEASGAVRVMRQGDSRPRKLKGHHGEGRALAYREDGYLVTGGEDGRMLIYAPGVGEPVQEVQVPAPIHALTLSTRRLVCACEGGAVYIFERERGRR
ncbi:hypothetical protein FRC98_15435 [Lujinxingia vulgaris]|uniref:WD40 repeat domain-containing protein n=1 Tax=Lujinxingia vulgaris TaxID=2600176 RepID=A0A5C6X1K4_9DELT|nr:hypothetical protein [Lujinxingia vulgaris]TXD35600.1 hypothetical protein FRC98_15435 [Lujinxingia vulgaris]